MKGRPLQASATEALNRLLQVGALNAEPPTQWDRADSYFAQQGGPQIAPGASWGTIGEVRVVRIGDPGAMASVYAAFLQQYYDATGVNPPRLGAQTVSHTTAFAKRAELLRSAIRTVDYVRHVLKGPLTRWLQMEYDMARSSMGAREETIYIDAYRGWVKIRKDFLPDDVEFEVFGSGGPAEEQAKQQAKLGSLQLAIQMDQVSVQAGNPPTVNVPEAIEQVLREGGWVDTDTIILSGEGGPVAGAVNPAMAGAGEGDQGPGPAIAALQALAG